MDFGGYVLSEQELKEAIKIHVVVYSLCMKELDSISAGDKKLWIETYHLIKTGRHL